MFSSIEQREYTGASGIGLQIAAAEFRIPVLSELSSSPEARGSRLVRRGRAFFKSLVAEEAGDDPASARRRSRMTVCSLTN
jgi:hypothetical protein